MLGCSQPSPWDEDLRLPHSGGTLFLAGPRNKNCLTECVHSHQPVVGDQNRRQCVRQHDRWRRKAADRLQPASGQRDECRQKDGRPDDAVREGVKRRGGAEPAKVERDEALPMVRSQLMRHPLARVS